MVENAQAGLPNILVKSHTYFYGINGNDTT